MAPRQEGGLDNPVILGAVQQPGLQLLERELLMLLLELKQGRRNRDQHSH